MPWRRKAIRPWLMPFGSDGRTYDPGLVVEAQRLPADDLRTSDIWLSARLTRAGRERIPACYRTAWQVRRLGEEQPCALLVQVAAHHLYGEILAAAPDRVVLSGRGRFIVLVPGRIVAVPRADPAWAWHTVADLILGTLPAKRSRRPELPESDLDALSTLSA